MPYIDEVSRRIGAAGYKRRAFHRYILTLIRGNVYPTGGEKGGSAHLADERGRANDKAGSSVARPATLFAD
jgi:hypothetical protein